MPQSPTPLILHRYRPIENRGKGGFATVDVVWDTRLQRRVAMKRIPLTISETDLPGINEARTAALLNDSHIVNVLDFEVTGTEALLIMEYVDGPTLGTLLRESPELLSLDIIASLATGISDALAYAHENQVLHLDIKPDNILISPKGHVKVTDFGLAQLSGVAGFSEPQGGTIGYMPPEQLTAGEVDERTDQWAFAILLYQLLTGANPFLASTVQESYDRIMTEAIVLPSAVRDDLDPAADEVLLRALDAEKDGRYPTVAAFMQELSAWLGNPGVGTRRLKARAQEREVADDADADADADSARADTAAGARDATSADGAPGKAGRERPDFVPAALPLLDRLPHRARGVLGRLVGALASGAMALLGLSGFDLPLYTDVQFLLAAGAVALVAFAGFLVPQLGSALAICALTAGLFARGWAIAAIIFFVVFGVWWVLAGRLGRGDSTMVTLTALLGACWMPFALPLLAGWTLNWRRAVVASVASGLLFILIVPISVPTTDTSIGGLTATDPATSSIGESATTATDLSIGEPAATAAADAAASAATALPPVSFAHSGLSLQTASGLIPDRLIAVLVEPMTWVLLLAWVVATLAMSLIAARGTRLTGALGAGLATILLAFAALIVPLSQQSGILLADTVATAAALAVSFILVCLLIWLGIPSQHESSDIEQKG
ncbi:MAG: serine/threonine protein kinase [Coriobacteriales bacterium]|jgi:tRNA A-37 threonylcarbamoyl transferase component Bud32|nr:serine/threonine protein kinase [Coriobacteriales bacterium]